MCLDNVLRRSHRRTTLWDAKHWIHIHTGAPKSLILPKSIVISGEFVCTMSNGRASPSTFSVIPETEIERRTVCPLHKHGSAISLKFRHKLYKCLQRLTRRQCSRVVSCNLRSKLRRQINPLRWKAMIIAWISSFPSQNISILGLSCLPISHSFGWD